MSREDEPGRLFHGGHARTVDWPAGRLPCACGFLREVLRLSRGHQSRALRARRHRRAGELIGCYYYLAIVKTMYFDEPAEGFYRMPGELRVVLGVCGLFNILFFVYPGPLVGLASAAAHSLF